MRREAQVGDKTHTLLPSIPSRRCARRAAASSDDAQHRVYTRILSSAHVSWPNCTGHFMRHFYWHLRQKMDNDLDSMHNGQLNKLSRYNKSVQFPCERHYFFMQIPSNRE